MSSDAVEVAWRRAANGDWLLHLVNHTAVSRPIERVLPLRDIVVSLPALADSKQLRARALVSGEELAVNRRDRAPSVRLPTLGAYEIIVITTKP